MGSGNLLLKCICRIAVERLTYSENTSATNGELGWKRQIRDHV